MATDQGAPGGAERAEDAPAFEEPLSSRWIELFGVDTAPELQPELFAQALEDLGRLLETRPDAKAETIVILERQFKADLGANTWAAATSTLSNYCGQSVAYLVNWLVYQNTEMRLAMIDELADAAAVSYLRSIVARFWDDLNAAQILVSASADDWSSIDKQVFYDTLAGGYLFVIRLTKTTGEIVTLETTADSILNLTRHLMAMIVAVGSPADYSPERGMAFLEQLVQVNAFFMPGEPAPEHTQETEGPPAPAD